MYLLSFIYHPINGSIDQYITNDTVGVNDNLGLGWIRLPRKINRLAAQMRAYTQDQPETVGWNTPRM